MLDYCLLYFISRSLPLYPPANILPSDKIKRRSSLDERLMGKGTSPGDAASLNVSRNPGKPRVERNR